MNDKFFGDEGLYRAVLPTEMFWKKNGRGSSAVFRDKNGLSVDRGDYRSDEEVKADMSKRLSGTIIKVRVSNCLETEALVKYLPSRNNKYHSEIHGSESELILSASQRRHLAMCAQIVD